MVSRKTALANAKLLKEYQSINPRMMGAELVERMKADHGIAVNLHSAQTAACNYRAALRKVGGRVPKAIPNINGHHKAEPNAVAAAIVSLKTASIVLGGKEATKQVLEAIY